MEAEERASAPILMLNSTGLTSVEMPGPVASSSLSKVVDLLGGPRHLAGVLSAHSDNSNAIQAVPELRLRPNNPFAHPVTGNIVDTGNLLLKVTKRRRKHRRLNSDVPDCGLFCVESVGTIGRTIRFRG